jgi:uncharacterized protein involved in cysteine biosynthesis
MSAAASPRKRCQVCGEPLRGATSCPRCGGLLPAAERLAVARTSGAPVTGFARGVRAYLAGIEFTLEQPRLRRWCLVPVLLAVAIFAATVLGCFELLHDLPARWLSGEWWSWIDWLRGVARVLLDILVYPLILLVALAATYVLGSVLLSPICDHLSAITEELILGRAPPRRRTPWQVLEEDLYQPVAQSLKLALLQLGSSLLLFLASLFTGGLATPLAIMAAVYFAALIANDYPLARKGYSLSEKLAYQHAHLAQNLGFGLLAYLLPFLLPFAAVGATRSFFSLRPK